MAFRGFIFDFDGLILDTEGIHCKAWQEEFHHFDQPFPFEDWLKTIGTDYSLYDPGKHLSVISGAKISPGQAEENVLARCAEMLETAPLLPGVETFIQKASAYKIPMAIATSSSRKWVSGHLQKYGLLQYFRQIISSDNVTKVKPDPEVYQKAVQALGIDPTQGLAFEDSMNGIKSAKSAGLSCYAIPNFVTSHLDLSLADCIYSSFDELDPAQLIAAL